MKVPGIGSARIAKDLCFSLAEFKGRLARVRGFMRERDLDVLVVTTPENIFYMSGYQTPGYYCKQCLLVPMNGRPIHLTRGTEETNARMLSWIDRTDSYMDHEDPVELFAATLKKDGFARSRVGVEKISWFLTVADYERLRELVPAAVFVDGSMIVESCRVIKSAAELAYIRRAARCAEAGMRAALAAIRPGVTEDNVAAVIQKTVTDMGSEYPGLPVFVASGVRSSLAHATWAGRRLGRGDPVVIEISGTIKRYSAALMRAACVGRPAAKLKRMNDVSRRALERMLKAIRPGRPLEECWKVWADTLSRAGFEGRFKRTGYSIGVNFPPDWGEGYILSFRRGEKRLLEPNMTFHIPSIVKIFGYADSPTSETVRVTRTGSEVITDFPRRLFTCPVEV
jgi:Xaa-Pro dipeptidase